MRLDRCVRHGSVCCAHDDDSNNSKKTKQNKKKTKNRYIHRLLKQSVGWGGEKGGASVSAKGTEEKTALKPLTTLCYTVPMYK